MFFAVFILLIKFNSIAEASSNNKCYLMTKNTDLLNRANNWLLERLNTKSEVFCLAKCNQIDLCGSVFFYPNQASNPDCYLYSKSFSTNELTPSNIANMYTIGKKCDFFLLNIVTMALIACPCGWSYFNQNCYMLFRSVMSFWSAQA